MGKQILFASMLACNLCIPFASGLTTSPASYSAHQEVQAPAQIWRAIIVRSAFASIARETEVVSCSTLQPPQALATPRPLLEPDANSDAVSVSFIISSDGRVQSPLILKSAGPLEDRRVLNAVRTWRYHPATCNGAPSDAEATVQFFLP